MTDHAPAHGFRLLLRLHTPVVMPVVAPRFETLCQEAMARLHQDWEVPHELPLTTCPDTGLYRGSQLILGVTEAQPLAAAPFTLASAVQRQALVDANDVRPLSSTFPDGNKLTHHQAIHAPFALFYGHGDGERCAQLFALLSGIGREHARHAGAFQVASVTDDDADRWRYRPWPIETAPADLDVPMTADRMTLGRGQRPQRVSRPPRVLQEVVNVA